MRKRTPLLIDRGRNGLLALVVALSFGVHLGLIWLVAEGGVSIRPHIPLVIGVTLVGGGDLPPAPPTALEAQAAAAKKKKLKKVLMNRARAKKAEKPDVILPGKPTATPSPVPTAKPTPSPSPSPRATATPRPTPKSTTIRKKATPTPKPTSTAKPKLARKKAGASKVTATKTKPAARKPDVAESKKASAKKSDAARSRPQSTPQPASGAATQAVAKPASAKRAAKMNAALDRARLGQGGGPGVGGGAGTGSGSVGVALDPEFAAYYGLMLERIRDAWFWPGRRPDLTVTVGFGVGAKGRLSDIRIVKRSRDRSYDGSVLRALRAVDPLPPPPLAFRRDFADVELVFHPADLEGAR